MAEQWNSLGLIPFLVYSHLAANKRQESLDQKLDDQRKEADQRFEAMVKGWEKQLVAMVNKYEDREQEIRARYDQVVAQYNTERDRMFRDMDRKLDDAIRFFQTR